MAENNRLISEVKTLEAAGSKVTFPFLNYTDAIQNAASFKHEGLVVPQSGATIFPTWEKYNGDPDNIYSYGPIADLGGRNLVRTKFEGLHVINFFGSSSSSTGKGVRINADGPLGGGLGPGGVPIRAELDAAGNPVANSWLFGVQFVMPMFGLDGTDAVAPGLLVPAAFQATLSGDATLAASTWNVYMSIARVLVNDGTRLASTF